MSLKTNLKEAVFQAARLSGANALARGANRQKLLVLGYHGVVAEEHNASGYMASIDSYMHRNAISVTRFRRQMELLARLFHPVSATDLIEWLDGVRPLPSHPVLVTFDDGYQNNLDHAAPELEKLGIPALFNVATGYIGHDRPLWPMEFDSLVFQWTAPEFPLPEGGELPLPADARERIPLAERLRNRCKRLPDQQRRSYLSRLRETQPLVEDSIDRELVAFMDWDGVRRLADCGFCIGAHTVSHPILTRLSAEDLKRELAESKQAIESETGRACPWFTYPNGGVDDFSPQVAAAVRDAGYRVGFSLTRKLHTRLLPEFEIGRFCITADASDAEFQAVISGLSRHLRFN
ncbi:MAG: polysaccharide deacetylase family protein [Planctomyces sp.]|nr:polysaccharide deacetylase family protein [Planctomyces sp.]